MWVESAASYSHPRSEMEKESVQELNWDVGPGNVHPNIRKIVPME